MCSVVLKKQFEKLVVLLTYCLLELLQEMPDVFVNGLSLLNYAVLMLLGVPVVNINLK